MAIRDDTQSRDNRKILLFISKYHPQWIDKCDLSVGYAKY
jgi:hypothetical protein